MTSKEPSVRFGAKAILGPSASSPNRSCDYPQILGLPQQAQSLASELDPNSLSLPSLVRFPLFQFFFFSRQTPAKLHLLMKLFDVD